MIVTTLLLSTVGTAGTALAAPECNEQTDPFDPQGGTNSEEKGTNGEEKAANADDGGGQPTDPAAGNEMENSESFQETDPNQRPAGRGYYKSNFEEQGGNADDGGKNICE